MTRFLLEKIFDHIKVLVEDEEEEPELEDLVIYHPNKFELAEALQHLRWQKKIDSKIVPICIKAIAKDVEAPKVTVLIISELINAEVLINTQITDSYLKKVELFPNKIGLCKILTIINYSELSRELAAYFIDIILCDKDSLHSKTNMGNANESSIILKHLAFIFRKLARSENATLMSVVFAFLYDLLQESSYFHLLKLMRFAFEYKNPQKLIIAFRILLDFKKVGAIAPEVMPLCILAILRDKKTPENTAGIIVILLSVGLLNSPAQTGSYFSEIARYTNKAFIENELNILFQPHTISYFKITPFSATKASSAYYAFTGLIAKMEPILINEISVFLKEMETPDTVDEFCKIIFFSTYENDEVWGETWCNFWENISSKIAENLWCILDENEKTFFRDGFDRIGRNRPLERDIFKPYLLESNGYKSYCSAMIFMPKRLNLSGDITEGNPLADIKKTFS